MKIKISIYTNNYERGKLKFEELIKNKVAIRLYKTRSQCYFESDTEIIQTAPIRQNSRGIKNHFIWIDKGSDYDSDAYLMMKYSIEPLARQLYDTSEQYEENKQLHIKYF